MEQERWLDTQPGVKLCKVLLQSSADAKHLCRILFLEREATEDKDDLGVHRGGTAPVLPCSLFLLVSAEALVGLVWFSVHLPAGAVSPASAP